MAMRGFWKSARLRPIAKRSARCATLSVPCVISPLRSLASVGVRGNSWLSFDPPLGSDALALSANLPTSK